MKHTNNDDENDPAYFVPDADASDSGHEPSKPDFPEEATDTVGPDDVDIHGKLAHLNALDLSKLTLAKRYVMITMMSPEHTDELGRLMLPSGSYPTLPALSAKQTQVAIDSLIKDKLIEIWKHGGSTCWEVKGAYAFKPRLKWNLDQRRKLNRQKKEEAAKRRQRKKDAEEGVPFAYEDDGNGVADGGVVHEEIRTKRGNLVPNHPEFFFNSKVPQRKRKAQEYMLLKQPSSRKGCILRMLPSFDPARDLSLLAAVIRFYLHMDSDNYGRVRVDVETLHGQLGPAITKRVGKTKIERAIREMEMKGHLKLFKRAEGTFGYLRDTAQHMLTQKRLNQNIPPLYADREFTHDSEKYKAFFQACRLHSAKRDKVEVAQYSERGDVHVINEYTSEAARRFLASYEKAIQEEPFCSMSPEEVCGFGDSIEIMTFYGSDYQFLHGFRTGLSALWMERLYNSDQEFFDGTGGHPKTHRILTHLIGMTPREYVELLKTKEGTASEDAGSEKRWAANPEGSSFWAEDEGPPVVPSDDDDEAPSIVP